MLKNTPVENLKEGMVFSNSVINKYGQVLISAGTLFNLKHLSLFRTWGIAAVSVHYSNDNFIDESDNVELKKIATERLKRRLLWEPANKTEVDIYNMAINKLMFDIVNEKGN
ncbi:MAG: hypothetical protein V1773_09965 [bacterium]